MTLSAPVFKWAYGGCINGPYCDTGWYASPAVADLDNDNQPEIIWGNYDLFALNGADGSVQWQASGHGRIWPGIAVADLTGNDSLEIIVRRGGGRCRTAGHDNDDGYGWGMYNENIAIADLDDDGLAEIFAPTDTHYITALHPNGEQLEVHPLYSASDHNDNGRITWAEVGVHVDQAADLEGYADCGVQHRPNFANAAPAIADVNGDDIRELIVVGDVYNCDLGDPDGDLYYLPWILQLDRTRWSGNGYDWTVIPTPATGGAAPPAPLSQDYEVIETTAVNAVLADLDNDGEKEILYPSHDGRVHVYWLDKTQHGNWPYDVPGSDIRFASEPIVADLDNNGLAELIFTSWPEKRDNLVGQLHVLDYLGNPLYTLTLPAPALGADWNGALGAPTLANIDADADLELIIGTSHSGVVTYD